MAHSPASLRRWSPDDGAWYVAQLSDPEIRRFTTESPATTTADFRAALAELDRRPDRAGFAIVDAATGELAGNMSAQRQPDGTAQVGYWVAASARGRGLARHALAQMCDWIIAHWAVRELTLWTHAENLASQRVAEGAGFRYRPERDELRPVGVHTWPARWYSRPAGPKASRPS